jgi:hypothetical protein
MYSHNVKAIPMIFGVPALQNAEIADAVDAGVLPEIDQQNLATVALDGMGDFLASRTGVDPLRI